MFRGVGLIVGHSSDFGTHMWQLWESVASLGGTARVTPSMGWHPNEIIFCDWV